MRPVLAEDDGASAGHVFAAVIAAALNDSDSAGISHAESFARDAVNVRFAAGRAVECDVADDDVLARNERRVGGRLDNELAAGETLAEIVVGVAGELDRESLRDERAEGLSAAALRFDDIGVGREGIAESLRDLGAEDGSEGAVGARDADVHLVRLLFLHERLEAGQERVLVEGLFELEVEDVLLVEVRGIPVPVAEDRREVDGFGALCDPLFAGLYEVGATYKFIDCADAELCHYLAELLCDEGHEVHDVFGLAAETAF